MREVVAPAGVLLVVAVATAVLVPTDAARASCAGSPGTRQTPVTFVGTAAEQRSGYTRFAVDQVLTGPDLSPEVWVLSGQEQPGWPFSLFVTVNSSVDAEFAADTAYVVGTDTSFSTSSCDIVEARSYSGSLQGREPVAEGSGGAEPPMGAVGRSLWGVGILGVLTAGGWSLRRARRRARSRRDAAA